MSADQFAARGIVHSTIFWGFNSKWFAIDYIASTGQAYLFAFLMATHSRLGLILSLVLIHSSVSIRRPWRLWDRFIKVALVHLDSCDNAIGTPGFCCRTYASLILGYIALLTTNSAIGTFCYTDDTTTIISCLDVLGRKIPSFPAHETGVVLPSVPVSLSDPDVIFSPPNGWTTSSTDANCTSNNIVYTTTVINATVTFNYSGKLHSLTKDMFQRWFVFSIQVPTWKSTC